MTLLAKTPTLFVGIGRPAAARPIKPMPGFSQKRALKAMS